MRKRKSKIIVRLKTPNRLVDIVINKNTLTAAFRLACLEIRSRNEEETINSTRNMIYSLKVLYFPLY